MRMMGDKSARGKLAGGLLVVGLLGMAAAQSTTPGAGSVAGQVYDDATNLPVRFAEIRLVPLPPATSPAGRFPGAIESPTERPTPSVSVIAAKAGMDGGFRVEGVPAGDYYAAALMPGYVERGAAMVMAFEVPDAQRQSLLASLPLVHIGPAQTSVLKLALHRGAVIAGRIQFADGSPVIGAPITCQAIHRPPSPGSQEHFTPSQQILLVLTNAAGSRSAIVTDDEGRYRIVGLSPDKYVVSTMLGLDHSGAGQIMLEGGGGSVSKGREHAYPELIPVYEPGVFRRQDAKVLEIKDGDQVTGADWTIDPAGLHRIRGKVLAALDHHAPTGAMVELREPGASEPQRFVEVEEDGSFQIDFVPAGSYTLKVTATDSPAPDASPEQQAKMVFYKTVELSIVMRDSNIVLDDTQLIALKPGEAARWPN